jgi:hypothetical protein
MAKRTKKILVKHGSDKRREKSKREPRKSNKRERDRRTEGSRKITKLGKGKFNKRKIFNYRYSTSGNYRDTKEDYRYNIYELVKTTLERRKKCSDGKVQKLIRWFSISIRELRRNWEKGNKRVRTSIKKREKISINKKASDGNTGITIGWHVGMREGGRQSTKDTQRTRKHERHTSKKVACIYDRSDNRVVKKILQKTYVIPAQNIRRGNYCNGYNLSSESIQEKIYLMDILMLRIRRKGTYLKKFVISITDRSRNRLKVVLKFVVNKMAENRDIRGKFIIIKNA